MTTTPPIDPKEFVNANGKRVIDLSGDDDDDHKPAEPATKRRKYDENKVRYLYNGSHSRGDQELPIPVVLVYEDRALGARVHQALLLWDDDADVVNFLTLVAENKEDRAEEARKRRIKVPPVLQALLDELGPEILEDSPVGQEDDFDFGPLQGGMNYWMDE
jgi:hypothetical protein